jgi:sec-independent protein translocase protein TatC
LETDRLAGSAKNMSEKEMTFIEHIIELRNRLKVVAVSFVAVLIF